MKIAWYVQKFKEKNVMQYTGIDTETGQEIFEGDIASRICLDPECSISHEGIVKFDSDSGMFVMIQEGGRRANLVYSGEHSDIRVGVQCIGNVFQNKDKAEKIILSLLIHP